MAIVVAVGNAELDEVAPTFRELLMGSGVSFVQARISDVDLGRKEVSLVGAVSDDLDGFMISDNADDRKSFGRRIIFPGGIFIKRVRTQKRM